MAERKAVNKYYPPDWDPAKQGSVNKRVGQHPLRDRARKLSQGILVIRFELPYNIWCDGCNNHVGMGVRYNAEKKKVGNYYSTPIYKFRMKCHLCDNYFEIQTDPKNHDYVVVCGARRKEQRWDPAENEQIVTDDKAMQKKLAMDAMFKLEHGSDDQQKSKLSRPSLGLLEHTRGQWKDDYMLNRLARSKFRSEKKKIKAKEDADKGLLAKSSLEIPLVEETKEDIQLAGLLKYTTTESFDEKQQQKRKQIQQRPLFTNPESSSVSPSSSSSGGSTSGTSHDKLQQQRQRMGLVSLVSSQSPSPFSESTKPARKTRQINLGLVKKGSSPSINSNVKNNGARTMSVVESKDLAKTGTTCDIKDLDVGDDDPKHSGSDNPATERKNALNFLMSHYGNSDGSEGSSDD